MPRSLLFALVLVIASVVAVVAVAIAPNRPGTSSPIVSMHESSGLDVRATAPDPSTGRRSLVVAPDPYRETPEVTCKVAYVSTTGNKAIQKYGTTDCADDANSQPQTGTEGNA